jgi:predicted phage tail protein
MTKPWYKSKTKLGVLIGGLGAIFTTVGAWMQGAVDVSTAITALMTEVGVILALFGVRDMPFVNKK